MSSPTLAAQPPIAPDHANKVAKVAKVTALFWVMKIAATTLGETAGDLFSMTLRVGYAISSLALLAIFAVTLVAQLRARRFHPALYWTVILATSTAGTTMSDWMDRTLGLGYATGSLILICCLVTTLFVWRLVEGTLSVEHIATPRAETFYWVAILFSNTLGTAAGDFLADDTGLGFGGGAVLISGVLLIIMALGRFTALSRVGLFWAAFVLTRPFGATFGDLLTKMPDKGGLGFGTLGSSAILAVILVGLVIYTAVKDARARHEPAGALSQTEPFMKFQEIYRSFKREFEVYRLLAKHPETPRVAKLLLGLAVGYLLLPFDLIPDFLPVIGHLDDAIIVPGLVALARRQIPAELIERCRAEVVAQTDN